MTSPQSNSAALTPLPTSTWAVTTWGASPAAVSPSAALPTSPKRRRRTTKTKSSAHSMHFLRPRLVSGFPRSCKINRQICGLHWATKTQVSETLMGLKNHCSPTMRVSITTSSSSSSKVAWSRILRVQVMQQWVLLWATLMGSGLRRVICSRRFRQPIFGMEWNEGRGGGVIWCLVEKQGEVGWSKKESLGLLLFCMG